MSRYPAYYGPKFAVAPMMDWTDTHCRSFHRVLSRRALLYTEMVTTGAVIHGPRERLLGFTRDEHPVAVQLGGSDPGDLAQAARICADFGYDEINLNVGCPSDRVQDGRFGACLMREPALVGECVAAMKAAVRLPVTVKCRIGVDDQDPVEALDALARAVRAAGADALIVHARKAWLQGLSPKENRDVPPLDYARVRALKAANPDLPIALNGGIKTIETALAELAPAQGVRLDGVMLGRAAYQDPGLLLRVDAEIFGEAAPPVPDAFAAIEAFEPYIARQLEAGVRLSSITRHMLGLFAGMPGARLYRRHLSTRAVLPGVGLETLREAVDIVRRALDATKAAA
ncbi:MAG: tRNA dihydrouridine(20/20a) synthase DusA [Salinarimonadaceae bacterium]|nr:MAG: tRNA dihydrouridine(20/20a) synthase DusA [Salinarimonadaceae bacterium]